MPTPQELEAKLWKALESERTVMLGLDGAEDGHTRPMTAQVEDDRSHIWFFAARDNALVNALSAGSGRAIATFASKGHDVFATFHGQLSVDDDPAAIDRLWNRFVAAWYPGGKTDPNIALLRLDPERAEIWLEGSSLVAGVKMLLGVNPRESYKDKVAQVPLGH